MAGKWKHIADYRRCARARNLDWLGSELPATTSTSTSWRCRQCGHVFESSYQQVNHCLHPCAKCRVPNRRLSAEAYHAIARARGFEWLDQAVPARVNVRTDWRCSQGHLWSTTYQAIKEGTSCPACIHLARKTEEDYQAFAERGITWIGEQLPSSIDEPTRWRCETGHEWTTRYRTIYLGSRCPHCKDKRRKKSLGRYVEVHYHQLAERCGFTWIGDTLPADSKQPTSWQCAAGHTWNAAFSDLYKGRGCPYCSGVAPKREVDYQALAAQQNIEWIADSLPKTAMTSTTWRCAEGHVFQASYERIKYRVTACPECRAPRMYGAADYRALAEALGWRWIGESIPPNICATTDWQCGQGHTWSMSYSWVAERGTCPVCTKNNRYHEVKMNKYAQAAVDAVKLSSHDKSLSPRDAWDQTTTRIFGPGTSSQRKGCPRDAFLGLCEEGLVAGIPAGDYCRSTENKRYALAAFSLLKQNAALSRQPKLLWERVMEGENKVHNSQMEVVIALWNANLLSEGIGD